MASDLELVHLAFYSAKLTTTPFYFDPFYIFYLSNKTVFTLLKTDLETGDPRTSCDQPH